MATRYGQQLLSALNDHEWAAAKKDVRRRLRCILEDLTQDRSDL
jgi:hypothetical protein